MSMKYISGLLYILLLTSVVTSGKAQSTMDEGVNDKYLKTIRLFPLLNEPKQELLPSAMPLSRQYTLLLEFDDLYAEYQRYFVKFIHCNADWSQSRLFPLDYLDTYNEFPIEDYEFSFNTRVPYVHYRLGLPSFKIPGNYLLIVYRESDDNISFTRRFVVFGDQVILDRNSEISGLGRLTRMSQEVQFSVKYSQSNIADPSRDIKATIRQNQRWDNAILGLTPTNVRYEMQLIEFRHFARENQFRGGNQFRFFDLRSLRYFGRNVKSVDLTKDPPEAVIEKDKTRKGRAYGSYLDRNGNYEIVHPTEADYALVYFFLESPKIDGDVYLAGAFSNWAQANTYKMVFIDENAGYMGSVLLKEGEYDYQYYVASSIMDENEFEGNHFQAENEYEILIYYYSRKLDTDLLIGYFRLLENSF